MRLKQANEVDLGQTSVGRLLFVLAVPAITSQVVNALYNMVDRMYIGHIPGEGAAALTGVGICFPIIMIVSAFAYLMGMGGAPRASIFMGKQDNITAEKILGNCFSALLMTAAVLTAVVLMFKEPLLLLFGASENTIDYAQQYITIYALGTVFVQATLGLNAFISAQGFAKISMMTVVIGAVTNIVLDPIFIFGLHMGVRGAATATVISQAISALWAYRFLRGKKTVLRLKREYLKPEKSILLPCVALGIAPFVMMSTESLLTLCFNTSLLKYGGDIAVGSMTILSSVMQFSMLPMQGLTQGGQPIISYSFGAKNMTRLKQAVKLQTVSCFVYAAIIWLLAELVPSVFAGIFTDDPQLVEFTTWALRIYMATSLLMGLQISCQQSFIAFGNAKISAFLAIFRKIIVLIPLIFLLPVFFMDKVFAVFLAEPVADAIAVAATVTLFLREMRRMLRDDPEN
ncbi:MAG: MATE family efflux transporter [Emergencia sp.]|jgi:putative MATE family efflux protein|uniref:MATE family efflux transporter n=1 Tax=Emergencia sp. 1XD21-10 TaxID=2304569 RepID=UPI001379C13C|nr:MATE family efflux transporter [Emergencia sp. 1XD21-10]MCI9475971.1 MATE family efflux transporter [Emergencia sp.]MCI9640027.1 MATE family efflux transporter [Emergencia sp.]NCF00312.1 MATE family efflux transporter [Emergencia sp. 1XD21-10]